MNFLCSVNTSMCALAISTKNTKILSLHDKIMPSRGSLHQLFLLKPKTTLKFSIIISLTSFSPASTCRRELTSLTKTSSSDSLTKSQGEERRIYQSIQILTRTLDCKLAARFRYRVTASNLLISAAPPPPVKTSRKIP